MKNWKSCRPIFRSGGWGGGEFLFCFHNPPPPPPAYAPVCKCVCVSLCLYVSLSLSLSLTQHTLSLFMSACLFKYLSPRLCLCMCLSLCLRCHFDCVNTCANHALNFAVHSISVRFSPLYSASNSLPVELMTQGYVKKERLVCYGS